MTTQTGRNTFVMPAVVDHYLDKISAETARIEVERCGDSLAYILYLKVYNGTGPTRCFRKAHLFSVREIPNFNEPFLWEANTSFPGAPLTVDARGPEQVQQALNSMLAQMPEGLTLRWEFDSSEDHLHTNRFTYVYNEETPRQLEVKELLEPLFVKAEALVKETRNIEGLYRAYVVRERDLEDTVRNTTNALSVIGTSTKEEKQVAKKMRASLAEAKRELKVAKKMVAEASKQHSEFRNSLREVKL